MDLDPIGTPCGFVWVVMPEEPGLDAEPYVFNTPEAAETFKNNHGGWVSEEPILTAEFNTEDEPEQHVGPWCGH